MTPYERQAVVEDVAQELLSQTIEQFPIQDVEKLGARMTAVSAFLDTPDVAYVMDTVRSEPLLMLWNLRNSYTHLSISEFNRCVFETGLFVPVKPTLLH